MSSTAEFASDGTTVVSVLAGYEADGYTTQVVAIDGGRLRCLACRTESPATDAKIDSLRRTEGASDPSDMAAVVALCCPSCGAKGTLVLKFGPDAEPEEVEALQLIDSESRLSEQRASGGIGAGGGGDADRDLPA